MLFLVTYLILGAAFTVLFSWLYPNLPYNLSESVTSFIYGFLAVLCGTFFPARYGRFLKKQNWIVNTVVVLAVGSIALLTFIRFYYFSPNLNEIEYFMVEILCLVIPLGVVDLLARRYKL